MEELLGQTIDGRFKVVRLIGAGAMGTVFEAIQLDLSRPCALKILQSSESPTANARFLREARFASRINHPNVVSIIAHGKDSRRNLSYIAMEYIKGESLEKTLQREKRLSWSRTRHIIIQICRALEAAHRCGVVHRDLKPANCMRTTSDGDADTIKLVDFGIAKAPEEIERTKLTALNAPIGTVDYMAYEQASGFDDVDHQADVWAAGIIVYEMVSGVLPFRSSPRTQMQRLVAILTSEPIPLSATVVAGSVPPGLSEILDKALLKDRSLRYASIAEFRGVLEGLGAFVASPRTDDPTTGPSAATSAATPAASLPTRIPLSPPQDSARVLSATGLRDPGGTAPPELPRRAISIASPVGPTELHPADVLTVATKPSSTVHITAPQPQNETDKGPARRTWFLASASLLFLVTVLVWKVSCDDDSAAQIALSTATGEGSTSSGGKSTSIGPSSTGPSSTGPSSTGSSPTGSSPTGSSSTGSSSTGLPAIMDKPPHSVSVRKMCKQAKKIVTTGIAKCWGPPPSHTNVFGLKVNDRGQVKQVTSDDKNLLRLPLGKCVVKLLNNENLGGKPVRKNFKCKLF